MSTRRMEQGKTHREPGSISRRETREFINKVIQEVAAEDMVGLYLSDEDAVELLGNLDHYTRTWGAAVALACFRKVLSSEEHDKSRAVAATCGRPEQNISSPDGGHTRRGVPTS